MDRENIADKVFCMSTSLRRLLRHLSCMHAGRWLPALWWVTTCASTSIACAGVATDIGVPLHSAARAPALAAERASDCGVAVPMDMASSSSHACAACCGVDVEARALPAPSPACGCIAQLGLSGPGHAAAAPPALRGPGSGRGV